MHAMNLHSNWDTMLVALPFVIMTMVGMFRLDEVFAPLGMASCLRADPGPEPTPGSGSPSAKRDNKSCINAPEK